VGRGFFCRRAVEDRRVSRIELRGDSQMLYCLLLVTELQQRPSEVEVGVGWVRTQSDRLSPALDGGTA